MTFYSGRDYEENHNAIAAPDTEAIRGAEIEAGILPEVNAALEWAARTLRLLQQYCRGAGALDTLIIITGADNLASRRMAEKCGFHHVGTARENPNGEPQPRGIRVGQF